MGALFVTVFLSSLLGSAHCAGMCGAFVLFAVSDTPDRSAPEPVLHGAYNIGRLITYMTLGLIAGAAGATLDLAGSFVGVQRVAATLAGVMVVGFGVVMGLRAMGVRVRRIGVPRYLQNLAVAGHRRAIGLPPVGRAGVTGLLTTLLPCGWLYAFVVVAAGTGEPLVGALVMGAFWLGTLPMLLCVGVGFRRAMGPLGRRLPLVAAGAMVVVGMTGIVWRSGLIGDTPDMFRMLEARAGTGEEPVSKIPDPSESMPCCDGPG